VLCVLAPWFAYACSDLSTGVPADLPAGAPGERHLGTPLGDRDRPYVCFSAVRMAGGPAPYRYFGQKLHLPASAMRDGAALALYRISFQTPSGEVLASHTCRIPATPAAIRLMDERFDVGDPRRVPSPRLRLDADPGCISAGSCALEPLIVTVSTGGYSGTGGAGMGGTPGLGMCEYSASVGDCWGDGWGSQYSFGPDGTFRPECDRDETGHCKTRAVSPTEWSDLSARVEAIKEYPDYCLGAKQALRGLIAQGPASWRIRFWDGYDLLSPTEQRLGQNLADAQGRYIEYDSHWIWNRPSLLVHEGIHYWYSQNPDNTGLVTPPDELETEAMAKTCV